MKEKFVVHLKANEQRKLYNTQNEGTVLPAVSPYLADVIHESFLGFIMHRQVQHGPRVCLSVIISFCCN
jgi:hypothetical protein